jgi:hypothetical protein
MIATIITLYQVLHLPLAQEKLDITKKTREQRQKAQRTITWDA